MSVYLQLLQDLNNDSYFKAWIATLLKEEAGL